MSVLASTETISFEQDAQLVDSLLALLSREQTSLVKIEIDAIDALMEEKGVLLQRINLTANKRYAALAALGFNANENGMVAWLQQRANPATTKMWEEFQKTLSEAKEMNRLNGMLIGKQFHRNQQLLNHLQGKSGAGDVYGKNGQAQSPVTSRAVLIA